MKGAGRILPGLVLLVGAAILVDAVLLPGSAEDRDFRPGETRYFSAPQWLASDRDVEHVNLRWRSVPGALAYTLWRSPDPGGSFQVIHMGRDTTFVDRQILDPGESRCYLLTATDWEFGESGFSDARCPPITR